MAPFAGLEAFERVVPAAKQPALGPAARLMRLELLQHFCPLESRHWLFPG
jgi:hypothetical protein